MIKAIVYDFDGVICDSVNVKTAAFADMYRPYGDEVMNEVIKYHLANGGISRFEKFRYYHKTLLGETLTETEVNQLAEMFSGIVKQKVIESSYLPGSYKFITKYASNYLQFICTGTPEDEIKKILKARNIDAFFDDVYGAPRTKETILSLIMSQHFLSPKEILFLGDSMTDYKAAKITGVLFIGFINQATNFPSGIVQVHDFTDKKLELAIMQEN
jgi:HAD superfamily hydrolase (TIGR01549 family)